MKEIIEQYGNVILTVVAILLLIGAVTVAFNTIPAFHDFLETMLDKFMTKAFPNP